MLRVRYVVLYVTDPEVWEPGFREMERMVEVAEAG